MNINSGIQRVHFQIVLALLLLLAPAVWAQTYYLGTTNLVEGPTAGSDSVTLVATNSWTATANATWLHLSAENQSGTVGMNVVFTFDANAGATRTGTLTIAGQTVTIIQAGSTYVPVSNPIQLTSSGQNFPNALAVDGAGNVYFADTGNESLIRKWIATSNITTTLVSSGLNFPYRAGVAVDGAGNVYIADTGNNAIKMWTAVSNTVTTLVDSGLNAPNGVDVDSAGNIYIADRNNNAIKKWVTASNILITLVDSGLNSPSGVAVDSAGNVFIADLGNNVIKEWIATSNSVITLVDSGLSLDYFSGVAVDGAGNVYIADYGSSAIIKWTALNSNVTQVASSGLKQPSDMAVDVAGNIYIADINNNSIKVLLRAFVDPTPKVEGSLPGSDTLSVVVPVIANLSGPFVPTSDSPWLTITGVTNGVVSFAFTVNNFANRTANITLLGQKISVTQLGPPNYLSLGTTNFLVGPMLGSNGVPLVANGSWTATANDAWLHLSTGYQSGTVSTNVIFTFDANPGITRTGTLTIAGQTVTIMQAGSTYVPVAVTNTLVASGLSGPRGVAVDSAGNVYIADTGNNAIKLWTAANNNVTTLVSSGLSGPRGVAVDGAGNVYIADTGNSAIKKWTVIGSTLTTLVSSGLSSPSGVAVDGLGNVYIADTTNNAIKVWTVANGNITTLVSTGLSSPYSVAVDNAGNVYIADTSSNTIKVCSVAGDTVSTLVSSGLSAPQGVAVDNAGNVYIADSINRAIKKWIAFSRTVTTLMSSGLSSPRGVVVDSAGNVYFADSGNNTIKKLTQAFVDITAKTETEAADSDSLPVVIPATANLSGTNAPTSDQSWLTITGVTNGVVSFAFATNTSFYSRSGNITLLGQKISITQQAVLRLSPGTTNLVEGPTAGSDSVALAANRTWTATANDPWLHLSTGYQSGTVGTNVVFTFDANAGATRTGTLTIAGKTVSIIQAGPAYVPVTNKTTLVSSGLSFPYGMAVDGAGNVYFADYNNNTINKWTAANNTVTTLVSSGLSNPEGIAVDGAGNVYIADYYNNAVKKWTAADNSLTTLLSTGISPRPTSVAVDGAGNVYIGVDSGVVIKWTAASSNVTTLVSGLSAPQGVAVDGAGNLYISSFRSVYKWTAANNKVTTLVASGLLAPRGVSIDGSGNVYIADTINKIMKWTAASNTLATLVSSGVSSPYGVAVDSAGNVYFSDSGNKNIKELPHAFVDPTPKVEVPRSGNDSLPVVIPATANLSGLFAPTSDQSWLTITGVTNGVVSFAYAAAGGTPTANITLLGQKIPIIRTQLGTTNLLEGPAAGSDSVAIASGSSWTATTNATWLRLSTAYKSGTGSTNLIFTFDANPGITRTGTLTIAGQTVTITQAGSTYVQVTNPTTLVYSNADFHSPNGVAVDGAGNVFITENLALAEWKAADNSFSTLQTFTFPPLPRLHGVAVDGAGNAYMAQHNLGSGTVNKRTVADGNNTTVVYSGFIPRGVAVDAQGNVYISDLGIKMFTAANSNVTYLASSGLNLPYGVAVDCVGNVYFADYGNSVIMKWTALNSNVTTLVASNAITPINRPMGVAVDGSGNVYFADSSNDAIKKWSAVDSSVTTVVSLGLKQPNGVALDGAGNIYIADTWNDAVKEVPRAFVDSTPKAGGPLGGNGVLPVVITASAKLTGPFVPTSDSPWLTITGVTNGVVSYAFTANYTTNRTGYITLLGQPIAVTQPAVLPPVLNNCTVLGNGSLRFGFTNNQGATFSVWSATNMMLPFTDWTLLATLTNNGSGQYNFTNLPGDSSQRFYRVTAP